MKNRVFLLCSVLLSATVAASAQTSAPTKVGIINIQQAIISTSDGQKAAKELEEKSAPKKKELERLQGEINALRDQLNKMSSVGSEDQKRKLMGDIDAKTKSFNRQVEDAQAELDQEQGRVLNELGGRMLAVLDKYAKDNGYAVILDISSQQTPVLFAATASTSPGKLSTSITRMPRSRNRCLRPVRLRRQLQNPVLPQQYPALPRHRSGPRRTGCKARGSQDSPGKSSLVPLS